MVESMQSLLDQFEQGTRERGKSTALYEDPDLAGAFADRELITALDKKLNEDPTYPVPEGFRKQIEKVPKYTYLVPDCIASHMKTSQKISTELMDDILFEAIGIHFLEPLVSFETKYKVKPAIAKKKINDPA